MSNPHYAHDLRLLDGNWDLTNVMNSQTILIVTGVDIAIELLDRPVAERLRDEIDKRGDISLGRRAIIISDALWFNDATLYAQPVIAVGGPSANALTRVLAYQGGTWHTKEGFQGSFIQGPQPQVTLWGEESAQVRDHVEDWIKNPNGLNDFLRLCWYSRGTPTAPAPVPATTAIPREGDGMETMDTYIENLINRKFANRRFEPAVREEIKKDIQARLDEFIMARVVAGFSDEDIVKFERLLQEGKSKAEAQQFAVDHITDFPTFLTHVLLDLLYLSV